MMHFGHKAKRKPSKESGIFQSLFTKTESKGGRAPNNAPLNTSHSVGKCSGLGLAWGARHCWTRFLSSTSPLFKSKPLCRKKFKTATLHQKKKKNRIYVHNFLSLCLLLRAGIDNQIVENDAIKTQIKDVIKILHVTQEFLLACLHKTTKTFGILQ